MDYQYVLTEKRGNIAVLTMNHPQANNLLDEQLCPQISQAIQELDGEQWVRVIIVRGAGKNFSTGGNLSKVLNLTADELRPYFSNLVQLYKTFRNLAKPTIAAVQGYAVGGGLSIALSCDLIVASEDAYFGAAAINVGLFSTTASAIMLPPIIGSKKALEMGLTGELISTQEAERLGIINQVVPQDKLDEAAIELAQRIADKSPLAILMGRRNFYACADMNYIQGLEHSLETLITLAATEEAREGIKAFLEKRQPRWKGYDESA